jgi:hypothetical protein
VSTDIEVVSDGDGLALFGDEKAIDLLLVAEGLDSRTIDMKRLLPSIATTGAAIQTLGVTQALAGRWVLLSEKSAALWNASEKMTGSAPGLSRAIVTSGGKTSGIMEVVTGTGSLLTNPAVLSGVGGLMSQMATQRAMEEITDYLAVIDAKVDDILRAQKDAVVASMISVGLIIDEAMTVRDSVGRVSETTWSKVQNAPQIIAHVQSYALRQLDALAEKAERATGVGELTKVSKDAERSVREWLAVIARCFQLADAIGILELDRVMDGSPDDLDNHRLGLKAARQKRLDLISRSTARLLARLDATGQLTNWQVLTNPFKSQDAVKAANNTGEAIVSFHRVVGITDERQAIEAKRWVDAAEQTRDDVFEFGAERVDEAVKLGTTTFDRARRAVGEAAGGLSERFARRNAREADDTTGP